MIDSSVRRESIRPSAWHSPVAGQNNSSYDHAVAMADSPHDSSFLMALARNSKGNIGTEGAEWERDRKNRQF